MVFDRFRIKRREDSPPTIKSEFLKIIPVPNPKLKVEKNQKNEITLILQRNESNEEKLEKKTERRRLKIRILPTPPQQQCKKIHLDSVGSIVWELCDGKRTVKEVAKCLCEKYKLLPSEAEISLNLYLNDLAKRGLMSFLSPKDAASKIGKVAEK